MLCCVCSVCMQCVYGCTSTRTWMLHKFLYMHINTHAEFLCSQSIRRLWSLLWSVIPSAASIVLSCRTGTFMSLWRNTIPLSTALKQGTINNSLLLLSTGVSEWYSCIFLQKSTKLCWVLVQYYILSYCFNLAGLLWIREAGEAGLHILIWLWYGKRQIFSIPWC